MVASAAPVPKVSDTASPVCSWLALLMMSPDWFCTKAKPRVSTACGLRWARLFFKRNKCCWWVCNCRCKLSARRSLSCTNCSVLLAICCAGETNLRAKKSSCCACWLRAVSYTHLDVYKRQITTLRLKTVIAMTQLLGWGKCWFHRLNVRLFNN